MAHKLIIAAIALGAVALVVAFAFPSLLNAGGLDKSNSARLAEGETALVGNGLELTVEQVDGAAGNATVTLQSSHSGDVETVEIDEGDRVPVNLQDGTVDVTLEETTDTDTAYLTATYGQTFAWSDEGVQMLDAMGILIVGLALIIVVGLLVVMVGGQ